MENGKTFQQLFQKIENIELKFYCQLIFFYKSSIN